MHRRQQHRTSKRRSARAMRPSRQAGFTLIEILSCVVLLGWLLYLLAPMVRDGYSAVMRAANGRQALSNQNVAAVLLDAARTRSVLGKLPEPYSGGGLRNAVLDPSDADLVSLFSQSGLLPRDINSDGTAAQNARVYQRTPDITMQVPLYFRSGPLVTLAYQIGAVYSTRCPISSGACAGVAGIPGASTALTLANVGSWAPTDPDYGVQIFSTLQLQRSMMQTTVTNVDLMRDNFQNYYRESQRLASATDTTNWYPAAATSLAGQNPATNQGCYDGWYDLSSPAVNILAQIGMDQARYGKTQWGGPLQYCRDYKPTAVGPNKVPHYGAIRLNSNVSAGVAPDSSNPTNNVVLTF